MQTWLRMLVIIWSVHGNTKCDMSSHGMPLPITNPNNECLVEKKKVCIQAYVILTLQHLLPLNHWLEIKQDPTEPIILDVRGTAAPTLATLSEDVSAQWSKRYNGYGAKEFIRITVTVHEFHCHLKTHADVGGRISDNDTMITRRRGGIRSVEKLPNFIVLKVWLGTLQVEALERYWF